MANDVVEEAIKGATQAVVNIASLISKLNGVDIVAGSKPDTLEVRFAYKPELIAEIRKVEGIRWDKDASCWVVPGEKAGQLKPIAENMRAILAGHESAREAVSSLAIDAAKALQKLNGAADGVQPRLSSFHPNGEGQIGEIIAVTDQFVAQLTGFGKGDGAAFIVLHEVDALNKAVEKGDRVEITYSGKGKATVQRALTQAERTKEFEAAMGSTIDGVFVGEREGQYVIKFDYNPALFSRLVRVDGVTFEREAKVWTVGTDKKEFVARAVADMRNEVVADKNDRAALETVAGNKISSAKVKDAYTKDGTTHSGEVVAVTERYVLQHTGKEYFALHRKEAFKEVPEVGKNARVEYQKGKAAPAEKSHSKGREIER